MTSGSVRLISSTFPDLAPILLQNIQRKVMPRIEAAQEIFEIGSYQDSIGNEAGWCLGRD